MKHLLKTLWLMKMAMIEYRRWRPHPRGGTPRVFYGQDRLPARTDSASGGIIKCQDLADLFPNSPTSPTLLYLVSSALPPHLPVLLRAAKHAGCPIVLNQNGVAYPAWHPQGWAEANRPLAAAYHAADYVFWQSEFCRISADRFLGSREGAGEILFNPVDTQVFTPRATTRPAGAPVILVSGSHLYRFRLESAILAFARFRKSHPASRLIVAGRYCWGPDEATCRREIRDVALQAGVDEGIDWRGTYTQAEAPALLREADSLLHPTYNDACPRLVVEAMACGLPVVYSASGGVPELVGPEAGVGLPAPRDWDTLHPPQPDALAVALETVLSNQTAMSAAARHRAVTLLDVKTWQHRHSLLFQKLSL